MNLKRKLSLVLKKKKLINLSPDSLCLPVDVTKAVAGGTGDDGTKNATERPKPPTNMM
ncbi:hypothetical protein [Thalassomonas actiniarum]|uniref:Uncharacterized protein n=1 Tax=Thalassomonas actiniarum TaxID=485447 RepID=A0AAF0C3N9_9GAMM|nr:hypothetical protein [Thalassomonas actiniarum]WDD99173.1 hypothetical protein SG35_000340 [Thalassomonas actiniarum]